MSHNLENNNLEKRVAYRNSIVGGLTQASCSCGLRGMAARDCNRGGEGRRQTVGRGTEGHFKRGHSLNNAEEASGRRDAGRGALYTERVPCSQEKFWVTMTADLAWRVHPTPGDRLQDGVIDKGKPPMCSLRQTRRRGRRGWPRPSRNDGPTRPALRSDADAAADGLREKGEAQVRRRERRRQELVVRGRGRGVRVGRRRR